MSLLTKISALSKEIELNRNSIFVVEGLLDKKALEGLGFDNILDISGKSLHEVVQSIPEKFNSATILSDFDEEGETIAGHLGKSLEAKGIYVNFNFRKKIHSLFGVRHIEDLNSFVKFKELYDSGSGGLVDKLFNQSRFRKQNST